MKGRTYAIAAVLAVGILAVLPLGVAAQGTQDPSPGSGTGTTSSPDPIGEPRSPDEVLTPGACRAGVMADSVCVTRDIAAWRGEPFTPPGVCLVGSTTCQILMDIYAPTEPGPWPLVVVVPGGGMAPNATMSYIDDLALAIADRGAVVMTAEWRQARGHPSADADVACAVGVARRTGPAYGADPARVVLVGHSNGVKPVVGTAFAIPALTPEAGSCDPTSGSLRPDAMVDIAGLISLKEAEQALADAAPAARIPVVIAQGGADDQPRVENARSFHALLDEHGWDSTLVEVPTADHPGILYEPTVLDAVMGLTAEP